jgi:hypothetical protein
MEKYIVNFFGYYIVLNRIDKDLNFEISHCKNKDCENFEEYNYSVAEKVFFKRHGKEIRRLKDFSEKVI